MSEPTPAVDVVIPTRNRPGKLRHCIAALLASDATEPFTIYVCDSSDPPEAAAVAALCAEHDRVELYHHGRLGYAQARNACRHVGRAPLIVSLDDDVYVEPSAVRRLVESHGAAERARVVAGSVAWGEGRTQPVVMRRIGYGRPWRPGEQPDFILTALYLYPRALLERCPFNERIRSSDDRFVGALWKGHDVEIVFAPAARAAHDDELTTALGGPDHQDSHIYANLFQALWVDRSPWLALQYEALGFAAGLKAWGRDRHQLRIFVLAWTRGHRLLWRDRRWLSSLLPDA